MNATQCALPIRWHLMGAVLGTSLLLIAAQASAEPPRGVAEYAACNNRIQSTPDAQSLKGNFPANVTELTPEQLTDASRPTPEQAQALTRLHEQWKACREDLLNTIESRYAEQKEVLMRSFVASDQVWSALVRGELNWGQANTARRQIVTQRQTEGAEADRKLLAQRQEDLRRQKDVLDRFAAFLKQRQAQ